VYNRRVPETIFADNFQSLLGLHRLTATEGAELLGTTRQTLSAWTTGRRLPDRDSLLRISRLFEISGDVLILRETEELLPLLADAERFANVQTKVRRARGGGSKPD
jgi:transcriptional regulator with XRE-family HTH domain